MALAKTAKQKPQPLIVVAVKASREEVERWKAAAMAERRPLSNWLRLRLVAADARDEEIAAHLKTTGATQSHE